MTLFITRYFLSEISAWIVFTPISFILFLFIGSFSSMPFSLTLMTAILTSTIVFGKYHETRKNYEKMFEQFPIDGRTMLHADIAFHGWISACYILYTVTVSSVLKSLVEKQWTFLTGNDLLQLICSSILLIVISLLLIWWNSPPNSLPIVVLFVGLFTSWNVFRQLTVNVNLSLLLGMIGLFIVVYYIIRNKQKRREIA